MLSKEDIKHRLDAIEQHAQWVEYYRESPELAKQAQQIVDNSKQVLIDYFEKVNTK